MSEPSPPRLRLGSGRSSWRGLGVTALAIGVGCSTADIPVLFAPAEDAGAPSIDAGPRVPDASFPRDAAAFGDGATSAGGATFGTREEYCAGTGPPPLIDVMADGGVVSTCPSLLAQRAFSYALCACDNYTSGNSLVTDAFDSAKGAYDAATATAAASVGVNGNFSPGSLQIRGSLWASNSATDLTTSSSMRVDRSLYVGGELNANGPTLSVGADAWLYGGIQAKADVTVNGTLHVPPGTPQNFAGTSQIMSTVSSAPFMVQRACDCEPSHLVDVAGVVETYQLHNDDNALGLDPMMLENMVAPSAAQAQLPCGRIFLHRIAPNGTVSIHLKAQGRVAIFVEGDISTSSDLIIDVPTGSQLDLFVEGAITVPGQFRVGDASNPAATRIYVGGDVNLQGPVALAGNLYTPRGSLILGQSAPTLFGSIFVGSVNAGSDVSIHYDQAILDAMPTSTSACPPPSACNTCSDCNGLACNSGICGTCTEDIQCCPPFVCDVTSGACVSTALPR